MKFGKLALVMPATKFPISEMFDLSTGSNGMVPQGLVIIKVDYSNLQLGRTDIPMFN
jgi:hypothetical protein